MSHLRKMGKKKWKIIIDLGYDEEGNRLRKYKTVNVTHTEAKEIMRNMENELLGTKEINGEILLKDHILEWIKTDSKELSPMTEEIYRVQINAYIIPNLGKYMLKDLTAKIIDDFYDKMLKEGKKRGKGGLSKRSVRYIHTVLKKALDKAVTWDRLKENPVKGTTPPKRNDYKNKDVKPKELIEIINSVEEDLYKDLFEFTLRTGLRRGEVLGLLWSAVDVDRKLISVMRTLQRLKGKGLGIKDLTKNGQAYTIPIGEKVINILKKLEAKQEQDKKVYGNSYKDDGFVFAWEDGSPISVDTPSHVFRRYADKCGYNYRYHDLRHGFGTMQILSGTHIKTLQQLLNHKSSRTTDIYSHIIEQQKTDAAEKIDDFF